MGLATVKAKLLLLATPPTVTTTVAAPLESPEGTTAVMDLLPQAVVDATTPPNVTVLPVPLVLPKPFPVMVTEVPDGPEVGDKLVMDGAAKREPLARRRKRKTDNEPTTARNGRMQAST